uniref:Uncharacterized protein n=1 Tax=Panagrolaimus sp. ES5 TaxID=591445 RepID=A0AC34EZ55_9BILA
MHYFFQNGRHLEEDEFKNAKSANNSTLSLHIAAYENLNEATSSDPDGLEKEFLKKNGETLGFVKNWGTSNHFNDGSTSIIPNPFEFPRQQDDRIIRPIVMQFTTSQRLINPNQMDANKRYRPSPLYMDPMNSQNRIPIRSVAYRTGGAIRPVAHPGSRIFTVRPSGGTVVHRLTPTRQPDVIDLEAEHGIRTQPVRQYSNYSINGEGISRVRYALPPMNRRPIYARPALRPTYYRTYPGIQQSLGRHRIIPYIPRYPNFRRYDYDPTEEDIDHAIQMEESKMQQEDNAYYYADPDFQRIEANIVKKENMARQQLEKQRLATLTSYHSRSADVNVVQNRQVQQAVQKLMSARSELLIKPNDDAIVTDVKMSLSAVVEQVCQQDRGEGWHKEILKKIRRVPEVPALHSQPIVKRSVQKHSEVMLNERSEFFKREILKRRARLELDVELEYGFVKQTRTGTIACLPCSQIYARIGSPISD